MRPNIRPQKGKIMQKIEYKPLEKIRVPRPTDRIDYFCQEVSGKRVLDLGAYDETAIDKKDEEYWLHGRMAEVAQSVLGIDNSDKIPPEGIITSKNSKIIKGNILKLDDSVETNEIDIIIAGELIEHLPFTFDFFKHIKSVGNFSGKEFILSTPNAVCLSNFFLGLFSMENNDLNHIQIYSLKTLHTQLLRAGFASWQFQPYYEIFPEMTRKSKGLMKAATQSFQKTVNIGEYLFPMLSGGWLVKIIV